MKISNYNFCESENCVVKIRTGSTKLEIIFSESEFYRRPLIDFLSFGQNVNLLLNLVPFKKFFENFIFVKFRIFENTK